MSDDFATEVLTKSRKGILRVRGDRKERIERMRAEIAELEAEVAHDNDLLRQLDDAIQARAALSPAPSEGDALGEVEDESVEMDELFEAGDETDEDYEPESVERYPFTLSYTLEEDGFGSGAYESYFEAQADFDRFKADQRYLTIVLKQDGEVLDTFARPSEPAAEAKGEEVDDGEAMRAAHSIMPGSGATFKTNAEIRASVRPHACTCHPDDNPPTPCQYKFALTDCLAAAAEAGLREYTMENGERRWAYEVKSFSVGIATPTDRNPDTITISASEQHAEESALAQDLPPLFKPEPPQAATPESLRAGGIVDSEASWWARKLAKEPA